MSSTKTEYAPVANGSADVPTNATVAPGDRKQKLVRKQTQSKAWKKALWLAGHSSVLVFGLTSLVFQVFWLPNKYYINSISYRLALVGAMAALFATSSHRFGMKSLPPITTLLAHQNFQYLILAVAWCLTFKSIFKLIPYILVSLLQLSSFQKINVVLKQQDFLSSLIAYDELFLIIYLLVRTLFFRNTSGYQLVLFLGFYWLRILYNKETGNLFMAIIGKLDGKVSTMKNPKIVKAWSKAKQYLETKDIDNDSKM
ncbi:hypothetical protein CAAN1_01S13212 [[Candida] anglica]|uniref:Uncharacterized protein n=1 Tax=[Candida] anglica TaxID=148631 RepID=A0ABP0EMJ7_9ASCO